MKNFILSLSLAALMVMGVNAQTPNPCQFAYPTAQYPTVVVTGGHFDVAHADRGACDFVPDVKQADFNKAYWASQPVAVQALQTSKDVFDDSRALAKAGYTIDATIMGGPNLADPYITNLLRIQYGYAWVPNALQPGIPVAPGLMFPGQPTYDPSKPPAGSIKVSLDLKDFKPAVVPPTPGPAPKLAVVGALNYGKIYYGGPGDSLTKYKNGAKYTDSRGTFTKTVYQGLMGQGSYWTLTSPPKPVVVKVAKAKKK
jgi:hypothetical protein